MSVPATRRFKDYELLALLGRGGMAELYAAQRHGAGGFATRVAVKLMLPQLRDDPAFVALFLNEGRIAGRLSHPNVCQVFELGEADGQLFLAMEYLEGVTWEALVRLLPAEPALRLAVVAGVGAQACEGLAHAHALCDAAGQPTPVVHRDVSPQNLFVTVHGVCKLLDFGVAKMLSAASNTSSGVLKGKLPYMAPEQLRAADIDPRADVFGLGVMIWEALVGEPLFARPSDYEIYRAILEADAPRVSARRPGYGDRIDALVQRALARDRDDRFASIRELGSALVEAAAPLGGVASAADLADLVTTLGAPIIAERNAKIARALERVDPPTIVARPPAANTVETVELRGQPVAVRRPRARWGAIALAAVLTTLAAVAVAWWVRRPAPTPPSGEHVVMTAIAADAAGDAAPAAESTGPTVPDAAPPAPPRDAGTGRTHRAPPSPSTSPTPQVSERVTGTALLSVDSDPYATVYLDKLRLPGTTPLFRREIPAGKHSVRLQLEDGRSKTIPVDARPGDTVNLGTITW